MKWKYQSFLFLSTFLLFLYGIANSKSDLWIDFDIKIIQNEVNRFQGQLYFSEDKEYTPNQQKQIYYKDILNKFQHIKIGIHNGNKIKHIRLDPLLNAGLVEIQNLTLIYQGEIYKIDLSTINHNIKHNIKIVENQKNHLILHCEAEDPFIEVTQSIIFKYLSRDTLIKALFYTILLYLIFLFFLKIYQLNLLQEILWFSIFTIYTLDTLFLISPHVAANLLLLFTFLSITLTLYQQKNVAYIYLKSIFWVIFFYGLMGYISLYITTELANPDYFYEKLFYIILALLIPLGFYNIKNFNQKFFKIMLTTMILLMAIIIICLNEKILQIDQHEIFGLIMRYSPWTQKNYMFWYVILMFGTLSFYNIQKKHDLAIILFILILSFFTVFGGYSLSAKLSYGIGVFLFLFLSVIQIEKKYLLTIIWIFTFYIVFSPIIFALIDFTFLHKLIERDAIYKTSFALIKEHWLFGYGYGSTLHIHLKDFVNELNLPTHYLNTYPGGHPHNLSLLFWLEFGTFGGLFLAYYIHKLLKYVIENTYLYTNQAALLSLIVSFDIITSFSWSIWYPQVLLTFSFFGIMLILSMNVRTLKKHIKK